MTSQASDWSTGTGSINTQFSSTGCKITGSAGNTANEYVFSNTPTGDYEIEFDVTAVYFDSASYGGSGMFIVDGVKAGWTASGSNLNIWDASSYDVTYQNFSTPLHVKCTCIGGHVTIYTDNTNRGTYTKQSSKIGVEAYNYRSITLKNIKIREL